METFNHLTVIATRKTVYIPEERLKRAFNFRIRTVYPGGLYASCTFSIPLFANEQLMIRGGDYLMVKNGNTLVFDGYIVNITPAPFGQVGNTEIELSGAWDYILRQQGINKRWRDNRLEDKVWTFSTNLTGDGDSQCTIDRQNRLRFTPKGVAWASGDYAAVRYTQPYGQTTKRITYSYDLQEGAQAWEISVWRSTDGSSFTQMTNASGETYGTGSTTVIAATGTGSIDVTLATPSRYLELRFYARGAQTAVEDGTYYGEYNTVRVYSETGNINLYEIANDIRGYTGMSADTTWLNASTMTYDLAPAFLTNGYEYYADILARAANFGDTSGNQVAYGLKPSRFTSDGSPALFLEARADPLTATTFDYQVTTHSAQVPALRYDSGSIRNWIVVTYTDETGASLTLDPDEQATLTDSTSSTAYGEKMLIVNAGNTDAAGALEYGERMLARYKDPIISVTGPIVIQDYLLNSSGVAIPASELIAGKMLKIMDIPNVQGVIAQTEYDDTKKTASLSLGAPDDYTTFLARLANQMQLSKIG